MRPSFYPQAIQVASAHLTSAPPAAPNCLLIRSCPDLILQDPMLLDDNWKNVRNKVS